MNLKRKLYYSLSPSLRFVARRLYYFPIDFYESLFHKKDKMIPPRGMIFIGSGDFIKQGNHILDLAKKHAGLQPNGHVLDVGCGIGRFAVPLTSFLNEDGAYFGFDIVKFGIDWCNKKIAADHPNFNFLHIDLENDLYNKKTTDKASHFSFPYPANSFDCVVLTSVFTHMMPEDVDNYLGQIHKVLKENGKCLATFFIITEDVEKEMKGGKTQFMFSHSFEGYKLMDKSVKEANIAFDDAYLCSLIEKNGLRVETFSQGGWSYGKDPLDFQDVLVLSKANSSEKKV